MLQPIKRLVTGAAVLAAFAVTQPAVATGSLELSSGAEYSGGDFGGTITTDVLVVPISARLRWEGWSVRASVPYVRVHGPADVIVVLDDSGSSNSGSGSSSSSGSGKGSSGTSGGSGSTGSSGSGRGGDDSFSNGRNVSGIGDATLSLTRSFDAIASSPVYVDLTGRVKFATGSESRGLGVGTTDYLAATEIGWAADHWSLFASGGRRFLGSTAILQRVDGWQWGAGGSVDVGRGVALGAVYSWRAAQVPGGISARAVEGNISVPLGKSWQADVYGSAGLSKGSPDYAAGIHVAWTVPL